MNDIDETSLLKPETGITAPEQEIKDVFKTAPENKAWMAGDPFTEDELQHRLQAAMAEMEAGNTISFSEAKQRIEQIKAFQTHGT